MNFIIKHFNELSTTELYEILKTRFEIFVTEQECIYQDLDDKDGRMVVKNVNDELMEILEMTGFTDFLEFEN